MPAQNSTLLEELSGAARGVFALLTGNRNAPNYFDFSQRGLIGSFIAYLIASSIVAYGPQLMGLSAPQGLASKALLLGLVLYAIQQGIAFIVLGQLKRTDGFIPLLVAYNWASSITSLLLMLLVIAGGSEIALVAIAIVVIIIEVNIARLVVTLAPMQVVIFIVAQLVGSTIGLLILSAVLPGAGLIPTL